MVRESPKLSSDSSQASGLPPANPQQQVLRGPAGEEAGGGKQGVFQPRVPQPMAIVSHSTSSSLLPPASLQQQVLRGPAGEEAGGGQGKQQKHLQPRSSHQTSSSLLPPASPQQQVVRGPAGEEAGGGQGKQQHLHPLPGPAGQETFRSKDVRMKQMPPAKIVQSYNRYCWQKPAGGYSLPKLVESEYCILCNHGCKCIGGACKGREVLVEKSSSHNRPGDFPTPAVIPGLKGSSDLSTNVLKAISRTRTKRKTGISVISVFERNQEDNSDSLVDALDFLLINNHLTQISGRFG